MHSFAGKLVLLTGAGRGIGRCLAARLGCLGARLVLTDVREEELRESAEEARSKGATVTTHVLDVTDHAAILRMRDRVRDACGRIDVLVNNAGVVFGGPFLEVPLAQHALTYAVNAVGLAAMTHAFLPDLVSRSEAHLVNIASASGLVALPYGATYASSKWAVIGFSESIRLELRALGHAHVRVTTVCPGYVQTGMFRGARAPRLTPPLTPEGLVEAIVDAILRDQVWVLEPAMVKAVSALRGILPQRLHDAIAHGFGLHQSMKSWQGHAAGRDGS
jgi:short-subunit dehydrogenase